MTIQEQKVYNLAYVTATIEAWKKYPGLKPAGDRYDICDALFHEIDNRPGCNACIGYFQWTELVLDYIEPNHRETERLQDRLIAKQLTK